MKVVLFLSTLFLGFSASASTYTCSYGIKKVTEGKFEFDARSTLAFELSSGVQLSCSEYSNENEVSGFGCGRIEIKDGVTHFVDYSTVSNGAAWLEIRHNSGDKPYFVKCELNP